MLYLILGQNKEKIDKQVEIISSDQGILKMDVFSLDLDMIRGELESTSLFASASDKKFIFVLDSIYDDENAINFIKQLSEIIKRSDKKIVLIESDIPKEEIDFFNNIGAEVIDIREKKEREYSFNPFALQDAIGERNIKKIWLEYSRLRITGIEAEEIIHKIVSKVRDMAAISNGVDKDSLGIKSDYPYNKSKRDAKNWKLEDLKGLYGKLVEIYHKSRSSSGQNDYSVKQGDSLDISLEKLLLSI